MHNGKKTLSEAVINDKRLATIDVCQLMGFFVYCPFVYSGSEILLGSMNNR